MDTSTRKLRLVYAHNGVDTYDPLFLGRFATDFETILATFRMPTQVTNEVPVVRLPDFGTMLRNRRLNNLRIALATIWRIFQMRYCLNKLKPHVVVGNWVTTYGLYAMLSGRKPFVLFAYGSDIVVDPYRSFLHRIITVKVVRSADLVLIDSEVQRRAVLSLGCSPEKIISFPWINLGDLTGVAPDSYFRSRLNWCDKSVVVSVRKHEPNYSVDTLIRAIPGILAEAPDTRFLIFGVGTQTARLVEAVRNMKIDKFVHFAGDVPRKILLRFMKDCDIYVSTSLTDGCSSSLLEAMFLGLPVVVTAIPGNSEWIHDGFNGLMFKKNDMKGLAKAILRLVGSPNESKLFARRANKEVRQRVDWNRASAELIDRIYRLYEQEARLH